MLKMCQISCLKLHQKRKKEKMSLFTLVPVPLISKLGVYRILCFVLCFEIVYYYGYLIIKDSSTDDNNNKNTPAKFNFPLSDERKFEERKM